MKRILTVLLALAALAPLTAKDLSPKAGAKIEITTNTSYGFSLDNPNKRGLEMDFSHFAIQYDMVPGGLLTNAVKTDDPYGFIQVEFGGLSFDWGNTSSLYDKDMNNPGKNTNLGFNGGDTGYNAPVNPASTGYSYPVYLERFASGINWGPWFLQLAAGGDEPENWRPWSNFLRGYIKSEFLQRWAYQDVRMQYQRPNIPTMLSKMSPQNIPDESQYWNTGNPYDSNGALAEKGTLRDIVLNPSGTLVGLSYSDTDYSMQLKFVTEKKWSQTPAESDAPGQAIGLDTAYTPQELPGLKAYASVGMESDYGAPGTPQPWAAGGKAGYTFPVTETVGLEPYFGVQIKHWDKIGTLGTLEYLNAHEASVGLTIHWPGDGGWQWDPLQRNGVLFPGLSLAYTIRDNNDLYDSDSEFIQKGSNPIQSILVTLYEESGDGGLLEGWGAETAVQYNDFQNFSKGLGADDYLSQLLVTSYLDYTFADVAGGNLVPWTKVFYDYLTQDTGGFMSNLKVDAGLRLEKAIKNTTLGVTYESKNLTGTTDDTTDLNSGWKGFGLARVWIEVRI